MRRSHFLPGLVLALTVVLFSDLGQAQCKHFTKKKCMPELGDYNSNGQYNGAVLFEGEEAAMVQPFYSNQDYRILVCSQPIISDKLFFEVLDYRGELLYSSEGTGKNYFDFNVESTQQLKIRIVVPESESMSNLKKNGCVSILVGFKNKQ